MGLCNSSKSPKLNQDKYEKGINEKHPHMLFFINSSLRKEPNFICKCCSKSFDNEGSFHCITCNFNICRECFVYSGGIFFDNITDGQKGNISKHPDHQLTYGITKTKGEKYKELNSRPVYKCNICETYFLVDYSKCWNCEQCNYNVCEKCFRENKGKFVN